MYAIPLAAQLAADATAELARSALPGAPTQSDNTTNSVQPIRRASAAWLRRLADRLATEPVDLQRKDRVEPARQPQRVRDGSGDPTRNATNKNVRTSGTLRDVVA